MTTKTIGDMGEHIALAHCISNGYEFVDRNYRSRYGEIDIIIKNSEYIVFAEVKTRHKNSYSTPAEAVDRRKQKRIITTAAIYLEKNPTDLQPRFDVIEIIYDKNIHINHIENAFCQTDDYAAF